MSLNSVPNANRLHIAVYGKRNSGKSSLINAITRQQTALVSDIAGTTTDPVYKAMEVPGVGPCVFIDTAGFDDTGKLGKLRVSKTMETMTKTDIAIMIFFGEDISQEMDIIQRLKDQKTPVIPIISKADLYDTIYMEEKIQKLSMKPIVVSSTKRTGIDELLKMIVRLLPEEYEMESITGRLVKKNDVVMLVMPQDSEAPKGRLILPQVQTIRDLLDNRCISINVTPDTMKSALVSLKKAPDLIITDSQVFDIVYEMVPKESHFTSFSILFAEHKGDLKEYVKGADAVDILNCNSHVLIAEACTHVPLSEDIGRVKIPAMLRKKFGDIKIDFVSGSDFPSNLKGYDLIIHCGGCMFNRKYLLSRIKSAKIAGVPITNYGVLLAKLNGILDKIAM